MAIVEVLAQASDALQNCGLSGSGLSGQNGDLPSWDRQGDVPQDLLAVIVEGKIL